MVLGSVFIVLAGLTVLEAWLIRKGVIQKWPRRYYAATSAPPRVRMGSFGLIPFAVMLFLLGAGLIVANLGGIGPPIALVMLLGAFASFFVAFRWMRKPPEWVKPEWLKRAERGDENLDHLAAVEGERRLVAVPPWQYWGTWALVAVAFVLSLVFDLSVGLSIGLGFAISLLVTARPRREGGAPTRRRGGRGRRSGR